MSQTTFDVASTADLNSAINEIDLSGADSAANTSYAITFTQSFTLTGQLAAINLASGDTLTIQGGGHALNGAGHYNGFFDYAGTVTIDDLAIDDTKAIGGSDGGGGGAGLGGGLFIASGGNVTLVGVTFSGDRAVGGSGGAEASGGGLDGGNGSSDATGVSAPGGGGIGFSATGGGYGIVPGAASGGAGGDSATPSDTGGGMFTGLGAGGGGDGGAGGTAGGIYDPNLETVRGGSGGGGGGGVGGSGGVDSNTGSGGDGGNGGYGGGGGAGGNEGGNGRPGGIEIVGAGGAGGFGGGGGDGGMGTDTAQPGGGVGTDVRGAGGVGGFGGGGGNGAAGGFGGGGNDGGGLGAGGAVFVQQGGSLTYSGGSVSGGSVAGGGSQFGGGGSALGSGLFLQGDETVTLAATSTAPLTISDVIADQSGSGGSGDGSLTIKGSGIVTLSGANTYAGGTTIDSGTLSLQNARAAGSGAITFVGSIGTTLLIGNGDAPANAIGGFRLGQTIDLAGVGIETAVTANAGNSETFSGGGGRNSTVTLQFAASQSFAKTRFYLASDGHGGTDITLVGVQQPRILGTQHGQPTTDEHSLAPFATVRISDPNLQPTDAVVITLTGERGTPTDADGTLSGAGLTKLAAGTYSLAGTNPSAVTSELAGLVFTPTAHQTPPGTSVTTYFTISDTFAPNQTVTDKSTAVVATAVNDAPTISGTHTTQETGQAAVSPFTGVTVSDPDTGVRDSLTITLSGAGGTLTGSGLTGSGSTYNLAAASPGTLTSKLDALRFVSAAPGTTTFALTASQNAGGSTRIATDNATTVVDTASPRSTGSVSSSTNALGLSDGTGESVAQTIDAGAGSETIVLPAVFQGFDTITGFTESNGDVLDLRAAMAPTGWNGSAASLGSYLQVTDGGGNTTLAIAPTGAGSATAIATLTGESYGLSDLVAHHSLLTG